MAYFYLLQHKQSGKKYAGVRYAKGCDSSDLLVKYFTSSRIVKKMSVIMKGENNPMYGKTSPLRGMRDPVIICEYCGKEANKGNYNRWHGDKCRHKPQIYHKYSNA